MAAVGCSDESCTVVAICAVDVGTSLQRALKQLKISISGCDQVGTLLCVVLYVNICTCLNQQIRNGKVVSVCCCNQSCSPVFVLGMDAGTLIQQLSDGLNIALSRGSNHLYIPRQCIIQDPFDFRKPAHLYMFEWCNAILVRNVNIGPTIHQQLHDLLVPLTAVAQNDGFQQSGPAQIIDVVYIHIGTREQLLNDLHMTPLGSRDEGSASETIGELRIGSCINGKF